MRAGCRLLRAGLIAVCALICLGAQLAAARTAQATPRPSAPPAPTVKQVCARPERPGYAACNAVQRTDAAARPRAVPRDAAPPGYGPADLQSAYRLPAGSAGAGQTVAIIDAYDDPSAEADLAVYRAQFGLPPCTTDNGCFRKADQRGGTIYPLPRADWATEISLDLDMVSAACPSCHILLVEAEDPSIQNLGTAVNAAVALGAKFVSNSYGASEDPAETGWDTSYYHHDGVVVTASTGDFGYGVEYPAASQFVTAVGGTSLVRDASTARGWTETAWDGAGSGCSAYEAKPAWQHDDGCAFKASADVSAIADPSTGVAVYDTFQTGGTWAVFGGTSAAAPLIAATYALAGTPVAGSNPAAYPYANPAAINDVTSGSNGTCDPAYLCTAGPGFDGPTGLGTPNGSGAFAMVDHGVVAGTLTSSGAGVAGAQVTIDQQTTTTDANGHYQLSVPVGTFDLTATKFGFASRTVPGVTVAKNATTSLDIALTAEATAAISGTITDGSSHHWPLAARITVPGTPAVATSDPATGHYSLTVLRDHAYTLHVDAHYPGYQAVDQPVNVAGSSLSQDLAVPVDATTCGAPGYRFDFAGATQAFDGTTAPAGWTVVNNTGSTGWTFNDTNEPNTTGGSGGFAAADALSGNAEDTDLLSPVVDLSSATTPIVQFHSHLQGSFNSTASVDVSVDGGQTWTNAWQNSGYPGVPGPGLTVVALPQAGGQAHVQVRFHLDGSYALWQVDDAFVGNRSCDALPGGLVTGHVTDQNTGAVVAGASVGDATSQADGFYSLFAPSGGQTITAGSTHYSSVPRTVNVAADAVTTADFTLPAGRLAVDHSTVTATTRMGSTTTATVTITNTGSAPATAHLAEEPGAFTPQARTAGAPTRLVRTSVNLGPHRTSRPHHAAAGSPAAAGSAWAPLANYPTRIMDEALVTDPVSGKVYAFGGFDGSTDTAASYVYDPKTQAWTPIAPLRVAREHASAAWINGRVYVTGGWEPTGATVARTEIYDPGTNTWSRGTDVPTPLAASGVAVYNARLYIVGGCDPVKCDHTDVQVYDPAADKWATAAPYAEPVAWLACGTLYGQIACAGGQTLDGSTRDGFSYDPATNAWTPIASLPI
ncbi:MAG TPA: carboxypeptidase regulatory-like domain-containing protein, partial [Jatrophihabitantaceae bacterium]